MNSSNVRYCGIQIKDLTSFGKQSFGTGFSGTISFSFWFRFCSVSGFGYSLGIRKCLRGETLVLNRPGECPPKRQMHGNCIFS